MICTWRHSWKRRECKAVHLRSTPRGFQGCETLLRKLFTIFPFKDSHVPGPCPSASARFVVSDLPKCSRPSRLPQCLLFCICVLSCYLIHLFLDEFVLNWPKRLAYALQVYATFPCSCNRKILTHWGNCSRLQRLELCCVLFVVQWGWMWDRYLYFSSERDAQNKAFLDLQTNEYSNSPGSPVRIKGLSEKGSV